MEFTKKERNEVRESVKRIMETDINCCVLITDTGISFGGSKNEFLTCLSVFVNNLKNKHIPDELIKTAVTLGLNNNIMEELIEVEEDEECSDDDEDEELTKSIKEKMDKIMEILEEK